MYFYAAMTFATFFLNRKFLPQNLDQTKNQPKNEQSKFAQSSNEVILLKNHNRLKSHEIGIMTVLSDRICFLAVTEAFMGAFAFDFYVGYFTVHMKE